MENIEEDKISNKTDAIESRHEDSSRVKIKSRETNNFNGNAKTEESEPVSNNLESNTKEEIYKSKTSEEIINTVPVKEYKFELRIKPFNGGWADMKRFLDEYEIYTEALGWDDYLRNQRLPLFIGNPINRLFIRRHENDQFKTWGKTKEYLTRFLGGPRLILERKYEKRKQGIREPVCLYANYLEDLAKNINKSKPNLINRFVTGLRPELKTELEINYPELQGDVEGLKEFDYYVAAANSLYLIKERYRLAEKWNRNKKNHAKLMVRGTNN